ncbi:alginate O-acetyltransferase AlgX-related protein [Microbacterium sp. A204]|uniref:alginate O-acetyltransferase AlgX-related protein n=1 Tax=Microbacterium sp. A204 TaxID=3457321 RepID=UPI003FD634EE
MSAGPSLHTMHAVEQERPRSRFRRIVYYVPLTILMVAVVVMSVVGVGARQSMQADAAQQRKEVLEQPSQQGTLPASCVASSFPRHSSDIWVGEQTAGSEAVFAAHPEVFGMRVEGRDGFEFWGDEQSFNFSQALGRAPWLDDQLGQWLVYFNDLEESLRKDGRDLVIVPAPAKWELYREKLPEWADALQGETHLEQFLEHAGDLPVVDVRQGMESAKQDAPVYSAVNTHWSPYGAYAAWEQTVTCAADLYPDSVWSQIQIPELDGITLSAAPNEFTPYGNSSNVEDWATPVLSSAEPVQSVITVDGLSQSGPEDGAVGLLDMPARTESSSGVGRALIMRDSTGEALAPIWANTFETTCQARHNLDYPDQRPDIIAQAADCDADTVLFVFTERYFSQAPPALPLG